MSDEKSPGVVARAASLLRALSVSDAAGGSTTQLAQATGVARPSAHRLLMALQAEGLVDRDQATGLWFLGPELYLLGGMAAARYDITAQAGDVLETLARESGESAYLSARRGEETVCLLSAEGSFPLRSHVLYEGIRFPLGVASAGLVILSYLDPREIDDYLDRTTLDDKWGAAHTADAIRQRIAETRLHGYTVNPGLLVEGSWGMAAAVFDRTDQPAWALSLTGVETRFRPDRQAELGALLLEQAHLLSTRLLRG